MTDTVLDTDVVCFPFFYVLKKLSEHCLLAILCVRTRKDNAKDIFGYVLIYIYDLRVFCLKTKGLTTALLSSCLLYVLLIINAFYQRLINSSSWKLTRQHMMLLGV